MQHSANMHSATVISKCSFQGLQPCKFKDFSSIFKDSSKIQGHSRALNLRLNSSIFKDLLSML